METIVKNRLRTITITSQSEPDRACFLYLNLTHYIDCHFSTEDWEILQEKVLTPEELKFTKEAAWYDDLLVINYTVPIMKRELEKVNCQYKIHLQFRMENISVRYDHLLNAQKLWKLERNPILNTYVRKWLKMAYDPNVEGVMIRRGWYQIGNLTGNTVVEPKDDKNLTYLSRLRRN